MEADVGKTQIGNLDGHVAALLCYLLGVIPGLIFFFGENRNRFVRFHALQSLLLTAATFLLAIPIGIVSVLTCGAGSVLGVIPTVFLVIALVKSIQKEYYRIPVIGDMAWNWSALPPEGPAA